MRRTRGPISKRLILDIEPIGFSDDGTPLYPISGAESDDDGNADDDSEDENDDSEDDAEEDKGKGKKPAPKKRRPDETPEQIKRRLNAEAKREREAREAAEAKLREIEDKEKSELELATRDRDEAVAANAKLKKENETLRLENAFFKQNGTEWHDPEIVLEMVRKDISLGDDGEVVGLEDALKELAKKKPFLVKKTDEDNDEGADGKKSSGPTGAAVGGKPSKKKMNAQQMTEKLKSTYRLDF